MAQNTTDMQEARISSISCERCRKRKIKCDKSIPCSKCTAAKVECLFPTGGTRQRPASKKQVQSLQSRIDWLENFIKELASADDISRRQQLAAFDASHPALGPAGRQASTSQSPQNSSFGNMIIAKSREGRMRKLTTRNAKLFYGSTSLFQIQMVATRAGSQPTSTSPTTVVEEATPPLSLHDGGSGNDDDCTSDSCDKIPFPDPDGPYGPHSSVCQELMGLFFRNLYWHHFCVYREYFLRDYDAKGGQYYSHMLLYSICATASLVSEDPSHRALAPSLAKHAEQLLYESLGLPDLTTLQSLVILSQLSIGQGMASKGWLFCGMACRLTHEMGLHLDPSNWNTNMESSVDREILRRVYWAVFIVDKQLSLYFGRPPALYPNEADVRDTIRIPYPLDWERLLDRYICKGASVGGFETACTIGCFIHQAELAKILHSIIVDVFGNRLQKPDPSTVAVTAQQIHLSLTKWLSMLPQPLHWNQWTVGQVRPYVLRLHMLFHTVMIILHRPPHQRLNDEAVRTGEDVEICYESLAAIMRLIRVYGRYYKYEFLPLDFAHTLSAAAGVLMMKRYMEDSSWTDKDIYRPLQQILEIADMIEHAWPCIAEIKEGIKDAMACTEGDVNDNSQSVNPNLGHIFQYGPGSIATPWTGAGEMGASMGDIGLLVTDDYLNCIQPNWPSDTQDLF